MSNRLLAYLLIITIVVCVTNALLALGLIRFGKLNLLKITGLVTDTGKTNISVLEVTSIMFTDALIQFGAGYVNATCTNCTMDTNGSVDQLCCLPEANQTINWSTPKYDNFTLENTGNRDALLNIMSSVSAAGFLGGTNPSFQIQVLEDEPGSCYGNLLTGWQEVNTTDPGTQFCDNFTYADTNDTLYIIAKVIVPSDATPGAKTATIIATAEGLV